MFGFLKKKNVKAEEPVESRVDVEMLEGGSVVCSECEAKLELGKYIPLSIVKCSRCETPFFVPYKIKDFWLFYPLGGGGMGSVYKAVHVKRPDLSFAVKILPRNKKRDQRLINALLNEAEIGKSFGRHPHLVPVVDYGNYKDEFYSAMDFIEGKRLDEIIETNEPVTQKFILLWALQILSAEQKIYDSGYLFKDMKPQNIIIDTSRNAKLFDYGLCVKIEEAAKCAESETVEGSPIYMPPERIRGQPEGMNSEIYSIGMVMYHALAGKSYYSSSDAYKLAKKHVASLRIASVANRMPKNINPSISELIDKMVAREPEDRYQSFRDAALAIKNIYNTLPK